MADIENQIKVTYECFDGFVSKAYVDEETLIGEDKYTDEPVSLAWSDDLDGYMQISNTEDDEVSTSPSAPVIVRKVQRWQPLSKKRSSRR